MTPLAPGTKDLIYDVALDPGAYTLHVSSEDAGTGAVLVELYQVP